jgi:hypothetical protein
MPEAAISGRHVDAQVSGEPSAYNVKRIGDEVSELPPTGSSPPDGVTTPANKGDSASASPIDASRLGIERDNLYSMPCSMMPRGTDALREWPAIRRRLLKSPPVDIVASPFIR